MSKNNDSVAQNIEEKVAKLHYWRILAQLWLGILSGTTAISLVTVNFALQYAIPEKLHTAETGRIVQKHVEFGTEFYLFVSLLFIIAMICLRDKTFLGEILNSLGKLRKKD